MLGLADADLCARLGAEQEEQRQRLTQADAALQRKA
jgi:hypothetical protein